MNVLQALASRRSIRGFKPDPVAPEILRNIMQLAGRSASFTNTQPWEVAIATGKTRDTLAARLYEAAASGVRGHSDVPYPRDWPEAAAARAQVHNTRRFETLGIAREDKVRREQVRINNFTLFGAPCAMFIFMDEGYGPWSTMDMGIFLQSIALAALGHGLGTCFQASLANYPDIVKEALDIEPHKKLLVGLSIGYPDLEAPLNAYHSARMEVDEFTRWFD
jgi:nitroreductase